MDSFGGRSWSLLGGQNRPKMGQVGLKTALETIFVEKRECSRNLIKTNGFSTFLTPRSIPKRPKIVLRRPQDGLEEVFFSHRFLSSILVGLGFDFGSLWAPFWEPKSVIFGIDLLMIFACRSEIAPRAARRISVGFLSNFCRISVGFLSDLFILRSPRDLKQSKKTRDKHLEAKTKSKSKQQRHRHKEITTVRFKQTKHNAKDKSDKTP